MLSSKKLLKLINPELNIDWSGYNSKNEEEFEGNYQILGPNEDGDEEDIMVDTDVTDVANVLADRHPFEEPSFMHTLNLDAIHALEFLEYFNSREAMIVAIKEYTICRGVDYKAFESEPTTFYANVQYGATCDWLIRVSLIKRQYCWVIRKYNGSHTCTNTTIFQDHVKLDSEMIAEAIKSLVEAANL
ncbi:hypothetical protein Ahy_B07g087338 [Arachis hypogaea]|uniref:Transposase MuDR plant domain-containing protein n=1 Tax=Arachis hypogaea TaxID=3818 RepID=A0A444YBT8_ARAHY|nr:hypothetical protein Ahy_B07g087338 [Arachis hypogaea]